MDSLATRLRQTHSHIQSLMTTLDIPAKATRLAALEAEAAAPDLWNTPDAAQQIMRELAALRDEVSRWRQLEARVADAAELAALGDADMLDELVAEADNIQQLADRMELEVVFSGPYDREDAIINIHAGAGGTDSQDWAEMLERMYLRWAEDNGFKADIVERSEGEEAGIKSVMISLRGPLAYGRLRSEQGVHRLVRLSPFDGANRRHTAFAKVELWPDIQADVNIEINENDLRIDTYRAGGAGGQHMQKNDTAVRITHKPSGVVVQCQNQRSQGQNRERAMQILKARLLEMERSRQEDELARLKGESINAEWGNQIRSYVLHPYQMVKDHRTSHESGNTQNVLDGNITSFMDAYLRAKLDALSSGG